MNNSHVHSILVLDDEDMLRQTVCDYLEDEGYHVLPASSAEEALELLKSEHVDLCMVDMRLPGMDGNEFILRANKLNADLKFIIYTGSTDYKLPKELSDIGVIREHVFQKPLIDLSILAKTIFKMGGIGELD